MEGCWKRGFGLDLKKKKIGGFDGTNRNEYEITPNDMQELRDVIEDGKNQFFEDGQLNMSLPRIHSATKGQTED